ncbi:hypothetical protein [Cupriavidus sp.]|uniref:hypothetical protein n=1 Tax=Cupriavidus sp. TaxID=1873897 RepID=UPI0025C2ACF3|nr:hypothetical protein [Cupriavidus sp.]MCA3186251.1 hypothetical protein [Cupriavidus sp.]MCA3191200.1 hypothetical protein [Cupriavidus sp.]MCA3200264.1 hypothetical protein [Cupriavidus sp.]MCA3205465.1 hypothetical protein [Cupriavidus sp.]MCA3206679.1 hypothetical protein [Cupriavidus sp.]
MQAKIYKGFVLRGFFWPIKNGWFVSSGGVDQNSIRVCESEEIACFPTSKEAVESGLAWAREWVECHC